MCIEHVSVKPNRTSGIDNIFVRSSEALIQRTGPILDEDPHKNSN